MPQARSSKAGTRMFSPLFALLKEVLPSSIIGLIVMVSIIIAGAAMWLQEGALKEEGRDRDRLIRSLRLGGDWRRHYVYWITRALNRVDRFLGDADKADCSLPSPFGNRRAEPYWTGWSFGVCALIALGYPIMSMIATWIWAGDGGELAVVLGLPAGAAPRDRAIVAALIVWVGFVVWKSARNHLWRSAFWLAAGFVAAVSVSVSVSASGSGAVFGAIALCGASAVALAGAGAVVVAGVVAGAGIGAGAVFVFVIGAGALVGASAGAIAIAVPVAVLWLAERADWQRRMGHFWLLAWPTMLATTYLGLWAGTAAAVPQRAKVLLVMVGVVPLLNVPLDWASIGATRALLRRGCERGAPSPLLLGLLDFAIGLVLLIILAALMVVALHAADWFTMRAGGAVLINVPQRLYRLIVTPADPGNWWIDLTVFSTLIPSAMNLAVGMFSLVTVSFPKHRSRLIAKIRCLRGPGFDRTRREILLALGVQAFLGAFAAGLAIWGTVSALLLLAPWFLYGLEYEAVYVEWLLPA